MTTTPDHTDDPEPRFRRRLTDAMHDRVVIPRDLYERLMNPNDPFGKRRRVCPKSVESEKTLFATGENETK